MLHREFTLTPEEAGERLDYFLVKIFPDKSRSYWQNNIKNASVLVNNNRARSATLRVAEKIREDD